MCAVITGVDRLNIACHGLTADTVPDALSTNPAGVWNHAFTVTTNQADAAPDAAIGMPDIQCFHGDSRCQPYR